MCGMNLQALGIKQLYNPLDIIIGVNYILDRYAKEKSKVEVSSYSIVGQLPIDIDDLNELNIIKTEWPDSDESDGKSEDYMLFMNSDNQDQVGMHYIIKMIQPY